MSERQDSLWIRDIKEAMARVEEQIGYRRLYDSIGCSPADRDELWFSFQTQDCYIDVYTCST